LANGSIYANKQSAPNKNKKKKREKRSDRDGHFGRFGFSGRSVGAYDFVAHDSFQRLQIEHATSFRSFIVFLY
jgi:hypothetical protein